MASPLFATKPVDRLVADTQDQQSQLSAPSACST